MKNYQIFTDATADISSYMLENLPLLQIIPMNLEIGGNEFTYGPNGNISCEEFYNLQRNGNFATTSQINSLTYLEHFEPFLKQETDILYICFSSGMSGTYQAAHIAIEELKTLYPNRKIICVDSLCASIGEGFLVHEALKKQAEGLTLEELEKWLLENRLKVCHWFTVDVFEHLKHGGRVSAVSAAIGTTLQIKPLLLVNNDGKLQVSAKPRGRKKAIAMQIEKLENSWLPELGNSVFIGHGDNLEAAEQLKDMISEKFPNADIKISEIGPIIGSHTGPGMLAVIFWGNQR